MSRSMGTTGSTVATRRRKSLTLVQQAWALATRYPQVHQPSVQRERLLWSIPLQPTPISTTYTVLINYRLGRHPRVYVTNPELVVRPDEALPHTFTQDGSLCLYYDEFSPSQDFIAHALVPWASEWLFHYELWLATGEWYGGGIEHRSQRKEQPS
jgi:hypothetical protein